MAINRVVERQSDVSSAIITAPYDACTPEKRQKTNGWLADVVHGNKLVPLRFENACRHRK